ncbi:MAG: SDR family oxidoreductase [Acidobacteriota bacterium]|nr:SDR family oxidoreductase [Acidobacteriota bacterium]
MKIKLKPIDEQAVVIFGAASGIGRQTALDFAEKGAKLALASRSEEGLKTLVEEIENKGGEAFYILADAANAEEVQNVADKAFERYGRIDTWVHNAGTLIFARFQDITPDEFKRVIEVNQLGQVYGAMAALPYLQKSGGGALIHITSVEAFRTVPFQSAYGSSKHGVKGFLQALRIELQGDKIPVSVTEIMPGAINTPIWDKGRNKFEYKMKPPVPPIYHPKIVSDAILYSAENVVRDMVAGGGALGVPLAERFSPKLTDKITHLIGFNQFSDEKQSANPPDGLFEPSDQMQQIEGRFSDQQLMSDPYTWAKTHPTKTNLALGAVAGVVGGFLAYKYLNKNE